jgi:hypothetical protein
MVRVFEVRHDCNMAAGAFWKLRGDTGFDDYYAKLDKQAFTLLANESKLDSDGQPCSHREFKLVMEENPVPRALRPMMPNNLVVDEFAFRVKCKFYHDRWDESHPYSYTTILPVMTDRVLVTGIQWCESITPNTCQLRARVTVTVLMGPVSWGVERSIEAEMRCAQHAA